MILSNFFPKITFMSFVCYKEINFNVFLSHLRATNRATTLKSTTIEVLDKNFKSRSSRTPKKNKKHIDNNFLN